MWLLFLFFLFPTKVYADAVYFDFSSPSYANEKSVLEVEMYFDVTDPRNFRVMPISRYIFSSRYWSEMPVLEEKMVYELSSSDFVSENLGFLVQDMRTSKVYKTPTHKIYGRDWLVDYITSLNESLARMIK